MKNKKDTATTGSFNFDYFLNELQQLTDKAALQKNPGLWLYRNNARTPLFMLEGLSRIYAAILNKKKFSKLTEQFKLLEDAIGAIDFYDSFAKEFGNNKKVPPAVIAYLQAQSREKIQSFNELLKEKEWLKNNVRINKIVKKLKEVHWANEKEEVKNARKFYIKTIGQINKFVTEKDFNFQKVESDVHELRRKLRWLSIYPQALRGSIQLSKGKTSPKHLAKYLTKEIITSPFNKMPDAGSHRHFLLLEQNYFLSLSWLIATLGNLKDEGLRLSILKEALQQTTSMNDEDTFKQVYQLAGNKQLSMEKILEESNKVCKTFFKEKNLDHLIIGTAGVA